MTEQNRQETEEILEQADSAEEMSETEAGETGKNGAAEATAQETDQPAETEDTPETEAESTDSSEDTEAADDAADGSEDDSAKDNDEQDPSGSKNKKGFFKKKEKKDPKEEKIAELTDRLQRQMAEFENFRKRTDKEKASMYQIGAKDVIEKLLPVVDNFERGLETADENDPFVDGMNKIYKQLTTMLTDLGVTPIEAVGQPFDPELHNAVMHIDDDSLGENIVAEEFQKGYKYKDSVVRFSMVKVAN